MQRGPEKGPGHLNDGGEVHSGSCPGLLDVAHILTAEAPNPSEGDHLGLWTGAEKALQSDQDQGGQLVLGGLPAQRDALPLHSRRRTITLHPLSRGETHRQGEDMHIDRPLILRGGGHAPLHLAADQSHHVDDPDLPLAGDLDLHTVVALALLQGTDLVQILGVHVGLFVHHHDPLGEDHLFLTGRDLHIVADLGVHIGDDILQFTHGEGVGLVADIAHVHIPPIDGGGPTATHRTDIMPLRRTVNQKKSEL